MPAVIAWRCPQDHPCPLVRLCPAGALTQNGFAAPVIDAEKCKDCGLCLENCGQGAVVETQSDGSNKIASPVF